MVAHACNLNYVGGVGKKRIASRMAWTKMQDLNQKTTKVKKLWMEHKW
jgi:hypothetical protein